jgi:pimeloyl-ACP methyl ester carboxylesterase
MARLLLALLLLAAPARADTFVLVHGAFAGPWAWEEVAPLLEAAGHEAVAVTLSTGDPETTVEDHAAAIVAAVEAAAPPVTLVAHSYGTRPATLAWGRARDRVARVVFVEGVAPQTDDLLALPGDDRSLATVVTLYPDAASAGLLSPPPGADPRAAPMALRALYAPVTVAAPLPDVPRAFVVAEASSLPALHHLGESLRDRRGWDLRTVPGGHDVPREAPEALAAILLGG